MGKSACSRIRKSAVLIVISSAALSGCLYSGEMGYVKPGPPAASANEKAVERAREAVWDTTVPELGKRFFVINNLDKSSGLINLSYTGDPERYVDCGSIKSHVKNLSIDRTYDIPAARAAQSYEVMGATFYHVGMKVNLEGRVNLIFEKASPNRTNVTVNTRYVLTRTRDEKASETISFNTGGSASFAPTFEGQVVECVANVL